MREFAKISPQFWINERGREIKRLGIHAQLIAFYLLTNPHSSMIGIYYLPIAFIAHETGVKTDDVMIALNQLINIHFCSYDENSEYVWVHDMAFDQMGPELKQTDNRVKGINDLFVSLPKLPFLNQFLDKYAKAFHIEKIKSISEQGPLKSLLSKEKEKQNENESENEKKNEIVMSGKPDIVDESKIFSIEKIDEQFEYGKVNSLQEQAKEILNFLNEKTKCRYRLEDTNLRFIITRLKSGASVDDCRAVIARKFRDWHGTDMQKYLRPATLFNPIKFEQYLGECVVENISDEVTQEGLMDDLK